jgi:Asp-tRNA(Asn)/Glu-tRNA(Gln) amidotransferase A subunit family amidase
VLAVPEGPYLQQASPEGLAAFEDQVKGLESAGYTVRQVEVLDDIAEIDHNHMLLMAYEMAQEHAQWFAQYADRYRPRTVAKIRRGKDVSAIEAAAARESQAKLRERLTQRLAEVGADLWISPSAPGTAPEGLDSTGDPAMNLPWTHAGLPTVTVPAGWGQNNLPFGLQCAGASGSDEQVLAWCEDLFAVMNRGE